MNQTTSPTSRRQFLRTSTAALLGGTIAPHINLSQKTFAASSEVIRVGLVGCGGRGTGAAAQALNADRHVMLTAMADVFEDKIKESFSNLRRALAEKADEKLNVTPERTFVGLDGYKKLIESGVDLVVLATPPGFRPIHFKAVVEAGKHVFIEKPMATDAPGLRSVLETVALSKQKNLAVVAGFCWRYDYARREFFQRIHDGQIGDIRAIYATYYTGPVKPMPPASARRPDMGDVEWQLRNWYNFVWLCGDSLVEQAVHSIDKIAWAMKDQPPLKAVAVGGRQIPSHGGNIFDHFEVNYEYPHGVRAFMASRQQSGCFSQTADYLAGTKGFAEIDPRLGPGITAETNWRYKGPKPDMYQVEHDELFASIRAGSPLNNGDRMCLSTLMALMGRMAAYTGQEITWQQAMNSQENLFPENLAWDSKLEVPPTALPGITHFV